MLEIDLDSIDTVVLSHGHLDHAGGLMAILKHITNPQIPVVLHPDAFLKRWIVIPNGPKVRLASIEEEKVLESGAKVVKIIEPYSLPENLAVTTSEIPRQTPFEQGMQAHHAEINGKLQPDPLIKEDQALVMNVKGKGLVIITGCAHAGIINTVRYAQEITGIKKVYSLIGGFHLSFPNEARIDPTIEELKKFRPTFIIPCHDTGFNATHAILNAMPDNLIPSVVGTTFKF
jgi:7,8-dihydropterin-6-yl-methyl-4-(beta-D-ribofuranosyl)aminobenzene 5'-phosphate synthase